MKLLNTQHSLSLPCVWISTVVLSLAIGDYFLWLNIWSEININHESFYLLEIFVKIKNSKQRDLDFWVKFGTGGRKTNKHDTNVYWRQRKEGKNQLCHTEFGENNAVRKEGWNRNCGKKGVEIKTADNWNQLKLVTPGFKFCSLHNWCHSPRKK